MNSEPQVEDMSLALQLNPQAVTDEERNWIAAEIRPWDDYNDLEDFSVPWLLFANIFYTRHGLRLRGTDYYRDVQEKTSPLQQAASDAFRPRDDEDFVHRVTWEDSATVGDRTGDRFVQLLFQGPETGPQWLLWGCIKVSVTVQIVPGAAGEFGVVTSMFKPAIPPSSTPYWVGKK
ncbi:hypothetical protein B0H16DRAFT_1461635 [Mycena metata]|uniref:Uncharacterized protein n=1 Tax=Mycena metata TaxID=1033252 RepID=A0AAD7IQF2_9AGAR|nr:hypothetical protein B0H16DRAFT_1461635 [Mycena metata]